MNIIQEVFIMLVRYRADKLVSNHRIPALFIMIYINSFDSKGTACLFAIYYLANQPPSTATVKPFT